MHRILQVAALLVCGTMIVLLALAYSAGRPGTAESPRAETAPLAAPRGGALHLRLSPALEDPDAAAAVREGSPDAGAPSAVPLALGAFAFVTFASAFWLGRSIRRRHAPAHLPQSQPATGTAATPDAITAEAFGAELEAREEALLQLARALEERDLEVQRLQREIADWQDAWRLAKPRLTEQQETIEDLQAELAAARTAVAGMRRYVGELQHQQRGAQPETRFTEDVDAWIERFMEPAPRA